MLPGNEINLVCLLGPTASGKTILATHLANKINGEIISADSRQVYKGMDIGSGKDLMDYIINGKQISYHLLDIVDAGSEYNVFRFQKDFINVYNLIRERGKMPILCGGTGMYIEAVIKGYKLINVPVNLALRDELGQLTMQDLERRLRSYRNLHNTTDTTIRKRLVRAIEIEEYYLHHPDTGEPYPELKPVILGININRETRRSRITERLNYRLKNGMIEEVQELLKAGISPKKLIFYGLEYKYLTMYLIGEISYGEMHTSLNTAIHQFAKRQMTWFRKMEKEGMKINWIEEKLPLEEKLKLANEIVQNPF